MKIGIVTTWFERGAAYVSRQFMNVLQETDEVFIYARGGEKYATADPKWNLKNVYWGKRDEKEWKYFGPTYINKLDFVNWTKNNQIEAILFNEQAWFEPMIWCKELGIKSIAYIDYYTEQTIPFFDIYDCIICNTKRHAFAFRNHHNMKYIKWGTDVELYQPQNYNNDKLTFFHSAGMSPYRKGTDLLLEAFYSLPNRAEARLLIHSQVNLSQKLPQLSKIIEHLKKEGSLEVIEETISAPGLYYKGDVYVYPTRLDGIGLTLMEAIASGLACITINNGPLNEFIEDTFGKLCEVEYYYSRSDAYYWPMAVTSIPSLVKRLESFINKEYDLSDMKIKARKYALENLDFNKNCQELHDIINNVEIRNASKELIISIQNYDNRNIILKRYDKIRYWLKPLAGVKPLLSRVAR